MPELLAASVCLLGAFVVVLSKVQVRLANRADTLLIVGVAAMEAGERGHHVFTAKHVALALLSDREVVELLEQHGTCIEALYADLEGLLPPRGDSPVTLKPGSHSQSIVSLLKATSARRFRPRPSHLLAELLGPEHLEIREVFGKHGIDAPRWPERPPQQKGTPGGSPAGQSGPYRLPPKSTATAEVLLWNDNKTSMAFVVETLCTVFGMARYRALGVMLAVHRSGVAIAGTYDREQADILSEAAMRLAKERGFPLRVTVREATIHRR